MVTHYLSIWEGESHLHLSLPLRDAEKRSKSCISALNMLIIHHHTWEPLTHSSITQQRHIHSETHTAKQTHLSINKQTSTSCSVTLKSKIRGWEVNNPLYNLITITFAAVLEGNWPIEAFILMAKHPDLVTEIRNPTS